MSIPFTIYIFIQIIQNSPIIHPFIAPHPQRCRAVAPPSARSSRRRRPSSAGRGAAPRRVPSQASGAPAMWSASGPARRPPGAEGSGFSSFVYIQTCISICEHIYIYMYICIHSFVMYTIHTYKIYAHHTYTLCLCAQIR